MNIFTFESQFCVISTSMHEISISINLILPLHNGKMYKWWTANNLNKLPITLLFGKTFFLSISPSKHYCFEICKKCHAIPQFASINQTFTSVLSSKYVGANVGCPNSGGCVWGERSWRNENHRIPVQSCYLLVMLSATI